MTNNNNNNIKPRRDELWQFSKDEALESLTVYCEVNHLDAGSMLETTFLCIINTLLQ